MKYLMFTVGIVLCFSACKKPQSPIFKEIKNLKVGKIKGGQVMLTADAHFFNPNQMKGKLTGTDLDIALKGNKVGVVNQTELVKIPANADFIIPLEASLSTNFLSKDWLGGVFSMLQNSTIPLNIKGDLNIKILEIPLTIPVDHVEEIRIQDLL